MTETESLRGVAKGVSVVIPSVCPGAWAGGGSKRGSGTGSFLISAFLTRKPDLNNSQAIAEASAPMGAVKCSPLLLIHTQAFGIRPVNRGLGCDSHPAQGRSKVWAPGQGRPSPSVPSECGQQDPRSGGDESPPALARAAAHCLCESLLLGRFLPPHPSSVVISAQQQPLGSTSRHS